MSNFRSRFKAFAANLNRCSERLEQVAVDRPVTLSFCIALAVAIIVVGLSWHYWSTDFDGFLENVAVEAHGMIFDLFVIGWFILWLNKRAEKQLDIRRYSHPKQEMNK